MTNKPPQHEKNTRPVSSTNSPIADRARGDQQSVWNEIGRLAQENQAISLTGGIPDYETPEVLREAAKRAIDEGFNQYSFKGAEPLLQAIAEKLSWHNSIEVDPSTDIVACCGTGEALTASLHAILNPEEEIILFEPFFASYLPMVKLTGAKPNFISLHTPDGLLDAEKLKIVFSRRPKAILVNTPQNPLGKIFSREELQLVADLCEDYNVFCVTDEVYEHFVFDGLKHISIATLGSMAERTITVSGFSKVFAITGWRVGYTVTANKDISTAISNLHNLFAVSGPHPLQIGIAETVKTLPTSFYENLSRVHAHKRDILLNALNDAGFSCIRPNGAFYLVADVEQMGFTDNFEFVKHLIKAARVACVPLTGFYNDEKLRKQFVRFAFCKKDETLLEVGKRLENIDFAK